MGTTRLSMTKQSCDLVLRNQVKKRHNIMSCPTQNQSRNSHELRNPVQEKVRSLRSLTTGAKRLHKLTQMSLRRWGVLLIVALFFLAGTVQGAVWTCSKGHKGRPEGQDVCGKDGCAVRRSQDDEKANEPTKDPRNRRTQVAATVRTRAADAIPSHLETFVRNVRGNFPKIYGESDKLFRKYEGKIREILNTEHPKEK